MDLRESSFFQKNGKFHKNQINYKKFFFFARFEKVRSSLNKTFQLFLRTSSNFVQTLFEASSKQFRRKFELVLKEVRRKSLNFGVAGMCVTPNIEPSSVTTEKATKTTTTWHCSIGINK
jgi:hypothetical protein